MYNLGIEAFLAVVRTENVSKAARQLNLAQSTVSKRLKVLEQEVGAVLIERGKGAKAIRLTPAGEAFVDLAERWGALWRETQNLPIDGLKLSLAIGTLDSINYAVFPGLYQAINKHQPQISLKIVTAHSPEMYDLIDRRQLDVAFTLLERTHPNVAVKKCYTEPIVGFCTASPTRPQPNLICPQELDPNFELYVNWGPSYQIWHDQQWDPACSGRVHLDTAQLILSFLHDVRQWALVPLSVAKVALTKGNYSIFRLAEPPPDRVCYKIIHKHPKASTVRSLEIFDQYLGLLLQQEFQS